MAKKIVRLSEKDMTRLIKKIIKENLGEKPKFTDFGGPEYPNWEDDEETTKYFNDAVNWAGSEDYKKYQNAYNEWEKSQGGESIDGLSSREHGSEDRISELERTIMNAQNELNRLRRRDRRG